MTARTLLIVLAAAPLAIAPACGSSDDSTGATDAGRDTGSHDPSKNCVKPGTPNNDQGIGGYCQTNDDCVAGKSLCTGEFGAPPDAWFCTRICADDPNCGAGLYCAQDSRGVACVPIVCGVADASVDAPGDAASDASIGDASDGATD